MSGILRIHQRLLSVYGDPPRPERDPLAILVSTILSQNTNDTNRDRAYERMRARFPTWEAVRDAPLEDLIEAIRPAGLAPTKAPRIQEALRRITAERGELSLDFLAQMPLEDARAWLLSIPGIGPKTAAIVLLFAFGRPAFPVDTHIYRVSRRLGLIPPRTTREQAHTLLEQMIPPDLYYPLHLNLIALGRDVCHPRNPECVRCVLQEDCAFYREQRSTSGPLHLLLIRHGQTVANLERRWTGWRESDLTDLGQAQVEALARRLATEVRDAVAIYTSPLGRALKTAAAIGKALGLEPVPLEGLREINFGKMEGLTLEEMRANYPDLYEQWRDRTNINFTWPGGERRADFFRRVAATCDEILSRHRSGTVIIVAHGGTLRAMLAYLLAEERAKWWAYDLGNCTLTRVVIEDGKARLLVLNDASHLEGLTAQSEIG
ncbi:MAG: histidine phosphatase family protein [Anaerolineae bacterium]|nr:histidine phosphatase family protein [Anaerolineae bacterium]MCX8067567.1 histidine phosphatase family protein [Anaerolineae bacterium]MDW7991400.1 histidine phosphatase family protein [Anaerolineae bacterium]